METRRRRLLLADDSITIQKVVTLTFADEGMDVATVGTGDDAINELEESGPPDILLADVHMPGLSGYELCELIKSDTRFQHVPVILLAGAFEPFDEAEARRVGADEVLSKPFQSIRDLIGKVGSLMGGKKHVEDVSLDAPARSEDDMRAATATSDAQTHAVSFEETMRDEATQGMDAIAQETAEPFTDFGMDDQLIEETPAERFGAAGEDFESAAVADERHESPAFAGAPREAFAEFTAATSAPRVFATHAASAAAADDALLDIGLMDAPAPAAAVADTDDFILDIDFDAPPPPPRPRRESEPQRPLDAPSAFAEAAHGFGERSAARTFIEPHVVPTEEPARMQEDQSVEGDIARAPFESQASERFDSAVGAAVAERGIDAQQLSDEVIDRIARRAVEMMSERAVQEIAWEVVPALAERLITKRLDELARKE